MGQDEYEARRAAERKKVERERMIEEVGRLAIEAVLAFLAGKASIQIGGHQIRLVRDP